MSSDNMIPGSDGESFGASVPHDFSLASLAAGTVVAVGPIKYSQFVWKVGDRVAGQFTQLLQTGEPSPLKVAPALILSRHEGTMATTAELNSTLGAGWDGIFTQ